MYGSLKDIIFENKYFPIPLSGKRPLSKNWTECKKPIQGYDKSNLGVLCGVSEYPVCGIDIDLLDDKASTNIMNFILQEYGETIYRIGKTPKVLLVYRTNKPVYKSVSSEFDIGKVEILGKGQQFAAYGIHPDTKKGYTWPGMLGCLKDNDFNSLPIIDENDISKILTFCNQYLKDRGFPLKKKNDSTEKSTDDSDINLSDFSKPIGLKVKEIENMVKLLNPDSDRDTWRNIGMAIHHELEGEQEGFDIWDAWSSESSKYNEKEMQGQWDSFGNNSGRPITAAYLMKLSKYKKEESTNVFKSISWDSSRFPDNPPEIPMIIENVLPKGIVSLFYSMGGAGKSTLIIYMAAIIAACKNFKELNFFNNKVNFGKTIIISAEDPEIILNKRYVSIIKGLAAANIIDYYELRDCIDKNLHMVCTMGNNVHLFKIENDGTLGKSKHYDDLMEEIKVHNNEGNLQLIVIDTKTRFSPGEGLGNVVAAQEITYYEKMAIDNNCSVMLVHHSNKASRDGSQGGKQAYRDVTALYDNTRAGWYLRGINEKEAEREGISEDEMKNYLYLDNSKNNFVPEHESYIIKRTGFSYSAKFQTPKIDVKKAEWGNNINILQDENKTLSQTEVINLLDIGRRKALKFLEKAEKEKIIEVGKVGKSYTYTLTDKGKMYGLEIN